MRISVIIPSYARPSDLQRCLEGLSRQSRPADETVVIVRDGDLETLRVVAACRAEHNNVRSVQVTQPGLIAAMNRGLDQAAGDLLVFTDDDSEAYPDWLERIEASFADPQIGAIGGRDWLQSPDEPALFRPARAKRVGVITW